MPSTRAERSSIEAALTELSWERGYRNLELSELLARAELDRRAFRRHFADLDDCLCATVQAATSRLLAAAAAAFAGERGWRNQLRAVAYAMLDFLEADHPRARLMVVEVLAGSERAIAIRESGMDALAALIDLGRGELDDPDSLSASTAEVTAGAIYNRIHALIEDGEFERGAEVLPELMYTAVLPYAGPEAALEELRRAPPSS
jgi:AcrR family transcriptional regulator